MGLKTMSLLSGASISATGGTALAFSDNGVSIQNGIQLVVPADTDYQTRRVVTVKNRPPALDAKTGVFGKDKKSISLSVPQVLSTGQVVFNTIRVEREVHPSFAAASADELNKLAAQLLTDSDVTSFWSAGAMS